MTIATLPTASSPLARTPRIKRWTVPEFHKICGDPAFESKRLILIEGDILEMPALNPPHDAALGLIEEALRTAFGPQHWVRGQMALVMGLATDPLPDVAVVPGSPRDYATTQPHAALLVVEVAESSLAYDVGDKANLYAAGGIQDYWVLDLVNRQLIVFRQPVADALELFGAAYRQRHILDASATASPLAAPSNPVAVAQLLP
jgi:Uma2 family endonuclease